MDDERFEELLDRTLASYSGAQPLCGLEERVLARVRGEGTRRPAVGRWAAVGMALILAGWFVSVHRERSGSCVILPTRREAGVIQVASSHRPVRRSIEQVLKIRRGRSFKGKIEKIRPSEEEVLLASFVAVHPAEASNAFAAARNSVERDFAIEPLHIEPVEVKSLQ